MQIIDNVNLPSRDNSDFDPWLETLLSKVKSLEEADSDDFVLRLEAERKPRSICYHLENNQNKTSAMISKRRDQIRVETYRRELPDPAASIKPKMVLVDAFIHEKTPEGLQSAAKQLYAVLGTPTPYSNHTATKIKVYHQAPANDPWCFTGGQIVGITNDFARDQWELRVGAEAVYLVPKEKFGKQVPKLLQYVVLNDHGGVELVMDTEFDFYFELAECLSEVA